MSYLVRAHFLAMAVMLLIPVWAHGADATLTVSDGWFRALPSGLPSGGYFILHNNGTTPVTLTGAESSACGMLMLHKSENVSGVSQMDDVSKVDVPPKGTLAFSPGGYHLMCMDATPAMKVGSKVDVTLKFGTGATLSSSFAVRNAAGR